MLRLGVWVFICRDLVCIICFKREMIFFAELLSLKPRYMVTLRGSPNSRTSFRVLAVLVRSTIKTTIKDISFPTLSFCSQSQLGERWKVMHGLRDSTSFRSWVYFSTEEEMVV